MRSVRMRILVTLLVLAVVGVGGWQLLPSQGDKNKTITVGTTDAVTSLDPAGAYDAGSGPCSATSSSRCSPSPRTAPPPSRTRQSCGFVGGGLRTYRCELRDG